MNRTNAVRMVAIADAETVPISTERASRALLEIRSLDIRQSSRGGCELKHTGLHRKRDDGTATAVRATKTTVAPNAGDTSAAGSSNAPPGHDFAALSILDAKLRVSQPGDPEELEAKDVAERVMRAPAPDSHMSDIGTNGGPPNGDGSNGGSPGDVVSGVSAVTRDPGVALDPAAKAFMEPRFGFDFSRVRIHADTQAAESAQAVSARAFTLGDHVVFGAGEYAPGSPDGRRLLAHELTHVVQQKGVMGRLSREPAATPTAAPPPAPPQQMPPDAATHSDLEALEAKSFEAAKARVRDNPPGRSPSASRRLATKNLCPSRTKSAS